MGKRKDDEGASESGPSAKRARRVTNVSNQNPIDHPKICQEIYETLRNYKADDGRVICEAFVRAPSRRTCPEYHKIVSNPIDFMRIQQKLKTDEYDTVDQFGVDFRLLIENAKSFYKKSSQEYKDATNLMSIYNEIKSKYFNDADDQSEASGRSRESSPAPSTRSLRSNSPSRSIRSKDTSPGRFCIGGSDPVDRVVLEGYLASILSLTDESGRRRCQAFKFLPSKDDYPDYYDVILNPIDLKLIAERLRADRYRSINELERELTAMFRNAKIYNEPGSLIYKDANFLKKFVVAKKSELLETATQPIDKIKVQQWTEMIDDLLQCTAMTPSTMDVDRNDSVQENLDEDSDEEDEKFSAADKFRTFYSTIRYARDDDDASTELAEPFLRLPSKTFYPDYYDEIKQPTSIYILNRKIKNEEYATFEELVAEANLIFNNAKLYNIEGSTIYINACKLQLIGNFKAQELDSSIDTSQYVMDIPMESMYGGDTEDSEQGTRSPVASPTLKIGKIRSRSSIAGDKPRGRPGRKSLDELMVRYRNKLFMVYNAVAEYKDVSGRLLCDAFMEKPSKKIYPDYYEIIDRPIDMKTIFSCIEFDKYTNTEQMSADFQLLFKNARAYNQENSQIFNDANTLDWIFKNALRQLGPTGVESPKILKEKFGWRTLFSWSKVRPPGGPTMKEGVGTQGGCGGKPRSERALEKASKKAAAQRQKKMMTLYNSIKDYKDPKGRILSTIFLKLPSKTDYPDYYDIIKKPIDMQKIHTKLTSAGGCQYESLDALVQDFVLMFDNACKFNDPESTIYKDALALQRHLLQKKSELKDEETIGKVPDVQASVQELLTNLFITVYNHQDAEGRSFSDSLAELPDLMRDKDPSASPISLDDIKRNLDKCRYRRLDRFQQDVFEVFDKARQLSRSDSEIFEDAVELQQFFIKTRDELCKNGKYYYSPALQFDTNRFANVLDVQRKEKKIFEMKEDENMPDDPRLAPSEKKEGDTDLDFVEEDGIKYTKGDFVYVKRNDDDDKLEPHVMRIVRLWRDGSSRENFVSGNWFYRPHETFHLARRKFLDQELFRTDIYDSVDVERLAGKCYVLFVRDYFKFKPAGFDDKDVYCCESKYLGRMKHSFKKMKYWHIDMTAEPIVLEERPASFVASRVPSIFVGGKSEELKYSDEKDSDDEDCSVLEFKREESVVERIDGAEPGAVYFEQLYCNGFWLKLGDGVYLKSSEKTLPDIVRVDRLWRNADGVANLAGVWFARPQDLNHDPQRLFYKKEVFATDRIDHSPLIQVKGKCAILSFSDYCTMRPVEFRDQDVYVCESWAPGSTSVGAADTSTAMEDVTAAMELETLQNLSPSTSLTSDLPPPQPVVRSFKLIPFDLSAKVLPEEILYFKTPVVPEKVSLSWHVQEETAAAVEQQISTDIGSVVSDLDGSELSLLKLLQGLTNTPKLGARSKSGYILFSAVVRKKIMTENPTCPFGVISKLVGVEWKKLTEEEKKRYEEHASKIAAEREKADLATGGRLAVPPGQMRVWMCKWRDCDWQFETSDQLYDHITTVHTSQIMEGGENQFVCLWLTCAKYRKDGKPFPSLPRLHRHMKEKHVPSSSKCILPQNKSKHYVPHGCSSPPSSTPQPQPCLTPSQLATNASFSSPQSQNANVQNGPQVVQFQHQSASRVVVDAQGNVVPGQVVIYQVQSGPGQPAGQIASTNAVPSNIAGQQQQTVVQQAQAQPQQPQGDPGRVVVQASKPAEPVFVVPPQRVQRVLHSEVYLRYLESLNTSQQLTVSRFDRYLGANRHNTPMPGGRLPSHFFDHKPESREDAVQALWNLRDHLLHDSLGLKRVLNPSEY